MDDSAIIALISVVASLLTVILGGIIRHLLTKLAAAESLLGSKNETISELRRQVDRLEITAQIQDRVLGALPRPEQQSGGVR